MSASLRLFVAALAISGLFAVVAGSAKADTSSGPLLTNIAQAKHESLKAIAANLR